MRCIPHSDTDIKTHYNGQPIQFSPVYLYRANSQQKVQVTYLRKPADRVVSPLCCNLPS